jgi:hypothetical protein
LSDEKVVKLVIPGAREPVDELLAKLKEERDLIASLFTVSRHKKGGYRILFSEGTTYDDIQTVHSFVALLNVELTRAVMHDSGITVV